MSQMPGSNPINTPPQPASGRGVRPEQVARVVSAYCKALIVMAFWAVALVAALGLAFIACRAVWFAVQKAIIALGI